MPRWLLPSLIVAATALFVIGVAIERNSENRHSEAGPGEIAHSEAGEASGETNEHAAEPATTKAAEGGEDRVLGLDAEATPLVAMTAAVSLALALAAWRSRAAVVLALIAVAIAVFAAFDIREVFHQLDESKAGLAALAVLVAVLHLAAAATAVRARSLNRQAGY
jgi:hypothetical protein